MTCSHCSLLNAEPPGNEALKKAYDVYEKADYKTALELLLPFAEAGEVVAQCTIGSLFHLGLGMDHDYQIAVKWYSAAAKQGCPLSWNNLASIHSILGDRNQAKECYRRAVELGFDLAPSDYYDRI